MPQLHLSSFAPGHAGEKWKWFVENLPQQSDIHIYESYLELLEKDKPDVICIASYTSGNGGIVLEAVRRGIHIFVEKPVAATLQELSLIKQELQKQKVDLMAMLAFRYYPEFYAAYLYIQNGTIGNPVLVTVQKSYKSGATLDQQGNTMLWVGAHAFDLATWLTGKKAISVYATESRAGNRSDMNSEAVAGAIVKLEEGTTAIIHMDYLRPLNAITHGDDRVRIAGTEGIIEIMNGKAFLLKSGELEIIKTENRKDMFGDFIAHLEGKGTCRISTEDSLKVTELCLKARQSAQESQSMQLNGNDL